MRKKGNGADRKKKKEKKSKCLIAEEKKVSEKSVPDTPPHND